MGTFIEDNCEFVEWSSSLIENCSDFSCTHDKDIENFFKNDFENYNNQLLGKSYGFVKANTSLELVAAFTVSNSMLPVSSLPKNIKNKIILLFCNPDVGIKSWKRCLSKELRRDWIMSF